MKKILMVNLVFLLLLVGMFLGFNLRSTQAEEEFRTFEGVVPFATSGGFIGFFDQRDGTVYIYNEELKEVSFKYKIKKLGEPAEDLFKDDGKV